ncbi:MAG: pilus assembly protein [Planctomycetaceae bacterium]|nr:pilus assembly protein [Planctomycetaceae bacterium]
MRRLTYPVHSTQQPRKAAATVEFAVTLPIFLILLMGMVEASCAINSTQTLHGALRDAGRLASMDYKQILGENVDPNAKVLQDIRNLLTASGIPGDAVTLAIVYSGGPNDGQPFDLSDEDNYLELFRVEATVPYTAVSTFPIDYFTGSDLYASVTFRKGRVSLISTN